jgi:hypothetical protein
MKPKFLLGLNGDVITNGNKHLSTFESPIIHFPIFIVKNLNLMKSFSFKGENPLRCTTQDEKGPILIAVIVYPIF